MSKLPSTISPEDLKVQFDREYFNWTGVGEAKGYRGIYADFPENLKFLEYIKSLNPESVLEAGCAYGFLVKRLNDAGIPAEGFDVSSFAIKMRVTDQIRQASVLDLSCYQNKQFDLVVSIELLEHIPEAYTDQALRELSRVSKRGVHWIAYKEVDDQFQTKDITHVNIKPYQWWVDKVGEICGSTHTIIYKETDWYPHPIRIPQQGSKKGLCVGSFINMLSNTETTVWLNVDMLDLKAYAEAYRYNFQQLDARKLPFPDNSFDYIIASHFLEHLSSEEGLGFLRECSRTLKPDGILRITVPDAELLTHKYLKNELAYFDEINPDCEKAETQLGKLSALLLGNHKAIYDASTLKLALEKTNLKPTLQKFNTSSRPDLMNQVFDFYPDLSLYMEATPLKESRVVASRSDRLRIAIVSGPFLKSPPDHYGGLEAVTADLAAALAELGQDVTLFAAKGSKRIGNYRLYETVEPVLNYGTDWGKVDWYEKEKEHYLALKDQLKDFDIIHGHNWFGFEYLYKRDHPEAKICHTHHGGMTWKTKPVEKMNLIAISHFMAALYSQQLGVNCNWVYNGINEKLYEFKAEKGKRLLYVGRFTPFKGVHIAIEVAKRLDMPLDLVGGAYEEPYFSQQIKPHVDGSQIKLYSEATHEQKVKLLQNARCLLFPSNNFGEPFGLVYVEAASCGTPTVALRDGAIPEIMVEGVSGFVTDTVEGMVDAVKHVGEIKPESCRRLVEQNFTRRVMAERYLALYRKILQGDEW